MVMRHLIQTLDAFVSPTLYNIQFKSIEMQAYFTAKELFHTNDISTLGVLSQAARRSSTLHP